MSGEDTPWVVKGVPAEIRQRVKVLAAEKKITMAEAVELIVKDFNPHWRDVQREIFPWTQQKRKEIRETVKDGRYRLVLLKLLHVLETVTISEAGGLPGVQLKMWDFDAALRMLQMATDNSAEVRAVLQEELVNEALAAYAHSHGVDQDQAARELMLEALKQKGLMP